MFVALDLPDDARASLAGWRDAGQQPKTYPAGTWGPNAAVTLTERHGHSWRE